MMSYEPDPYYGDPHEPYSLDESFYGYCSDCGSGLENWGAHSDGDGDRYDIIGCPNCQDEVYRVYMDDGDEYP